MSKTSGTAERHYTPKQQRVHRNVKMEMKSLDQRLKNLPVDFPDKDRRAREEKKIKARMDTLEEKLRKYNII